MVRMASTLVFNQLIKANAKTVSVREITESVQYGYTDKATTSEVGPKYVRITDLKDGQVIWETVPYCKCDNPEQYLLKQGDLIFARTGATTGKTHLFREMPPVAVFASYLIRVRPTKKINPEYLYFFFQSDLYWSQISSQKEGSAQPNVNGQKLSDIELPITDEETQGLICKFLAIVRARQDGSKQELPELPYPLEEQRRFVERIEILTTRIAKAQSLREEADLETEALYHSGMNKVFESLSIHPQLTLDDVCETIYRYPTFYGMSHLDNGIPVIRIEHILKDGTISKDWSRYWFISQEVSKKFPMTVLHEGDIVMGVRGSIGKLGMIGVDHDGAQLSPNCIRYAPNRKLIEPRYLFLFLRSPKGQQGMQDTSTATAIATIKASGIKKAMIPVPPLDE